MWLHVGVGDGMRMAMGVGSGCIIPARRLGRRHSQDLSLSPSVSVSLLRLRFCHMLLIVGIGGISRLVAGDEGWSLGVGLAATTTVEVEIGQGRQGGQTEAQASQGTLRGLWRIKSWSNSWVVLFFGGTGAETSEERDART